MHNYHATTARIGRGPADLCSAGCWSRPVIRGRSGWGGVRHVSRFHTQENDRG